MNMFTVLALEYVVAVYPIFFAAVLYILIELHARGCRLLSVLWKPFHPIFYRFRKCCNIRGSVINAFATFVCLSYSKILVTSFNITNYTKIQSSNHSDQPTSYYFNSSVDYRSPEITPYYIIAGFMAGVFCILPMITLLIFHTRLCMCFHRHTLLCEVVKVFQKHFKDGSNGTPDHRSFSALYFMFLASYLLAQYLQIEGAFFMKWFTLLFSLLVIAYLQPYKEKKYNCLNTFWLSFLITRLISIQYQRFTGTTGLNYALWIAAMLLPAVYISIIILYRVLRMVTSSICRKSCLRRSPINSNTANGIGDQFPDRINNSIEYKPLLQRTHS